MILEAQTLLPLAHSTQPSFCAIPPTISPAASQLSDRPSIVDNNRVHIFKNQPQPIGWDRVQNWLESAVTSAPPARDDFWAPGVPFSKLCTSKTTQPDHGKRQWLRVNQPKQVQTDSITSISKPLSSPCHSLADSPRRVIPFSSPGPNPTRRSFISLTSGCRLPAPPDSDQYPISTPRQTLKQENKGDFALETRVDDSFYFRARPRNLQAAFTSPMEKKPVFSASSLSTLTSPPANLSLASNLTETAPQSNEKYCISDKDSSAPNVSNGKGNVIQTTHRLSGLHGSKLQPEPRSIVLEPPKADMLQLQTNSQREIQRSLDTHRPNLTREIKDMGMKNNVNNPVTWDDKNMASQTDRGCAAVSGKCLQLKEQSCVPFSKSEGTGEPTLSSGDRSSFLKTVLRQSPESQVPPSQVVLQQDTDIVDTTHYPSSSVPHSMGSLVPSFASHSFPISERDDSSIIGQYQRLFNRSVNSFSEHASLSQFQKTPDAIFSPCTQDPLTTQERVIFALPKSESQRWHSSQTSLSRSHKTPPKSFSQIMTTESQELSVISSTPDQTSRVHTPLPITSTSIKDSPSQDLVLNFSSICNHTNETQSPRELAATRLMPLTAVSLSESSSPVAPPRLPTQAQSQWQVASSSCVKRTHVDSDACSELLEAPCRKIYGNMMPRSTRNLPIEVSPINSFSPLPKKRRKVEKQKKNLEQNTSESCNTQSIMSLACSNPWKDVAPAAISTRENDLANQSMKPKKTVHFMLDEGDQSSCSRKRYNQASSPPPAEDFIFSPGQKMPFSNHFSAMAVKKAKTPQGARECLLPSESQQAPASSAVGAMAEMFLNSENTDLPRVRAKNSRNTSPGSSKRRAGILKKFETEETQPSQNEDVNAVLDNLDEFVGGFNLDGDAITGMR